MRKGEGNFKGRGLPDERRNLTEYLGHNFLKLKNTITLVSKLKLFIMFFRNFGTEKIYN